jgi:hypothetical protein
MSVRQIKPGVGMPVHAVSISIYGKDIAKAKQLYDYVLAELNEAKTGLGGAVFDALNAEGKEPIKRVMLQGLEEDEFHDFVFE